MDGSIWWVVQGVVVAATAVTLVYALQAAREAARLSARAAELQAQSLRSPPAAVAESARVQRLAARPVLKVGLTVQGMSDVGRTPVVFALRVQNVGHGTAGIDEVR